MPLIIASLPHLFFANQSFRREENTVNGRWMDGRDVSRILSLWTVSFLATWAGAENWPQFRGAASGIVASGKLPIEWSAENNVVWKVALPGVGWSQPIVLDGRIFVTTAESDQQTKPDPSNTGPGFGGFASFFNADAAYSLQPPNATYRWKLFCLDALTGNVAWEKLVREGRPTMRIHANNTYASETPATDGERIVAYFGMMGVYCYDLAGELLWSKDLGAHPMQFGWGTGSSPILYGDLVYIQCDNDKTSFLVALDKNTGEEVWRVDRDEKSNWSTPYIWQNRFRIELVTAGGNGMRSYDPKTGDLLWSIGGSGRTATTPVGDKELLYVDSYDRLTGGHGVLAAIRAGAAGDMSLKPGESKSDHVAWSLRLRAYRIASPLLHDGNLYVLDQNLGIVRCHDAKTGEELGRERLPGARGFVASPLMNDGHIFCTDQNGRTTVLEAGAKLRVLASNDLREMCWSSPAVAGERLLVRTIDHLYCIGR
jgi:outer membrane protein assembly factor BamB